MPPKVSNVYGFALFNALSFQMVLGSPMVLYAKSLGASATVLGIIAGMLPLLVIFQIPAARFIVSVGYKRFVLSGWGARTVFIFLIAAVPLTHRFLDPASRLALVLFLLFLFNLSRGISSCAWLPWITSLIPARMRGRYLTREATLANLASFGAFVLAAAVLGSEPTPWRFMTIFLFSGFAGVASLLFLRRVPDAETPDELRISSARIPLRDIISFGPFRRLLAFTAAWSIASGGLVTFTVAFLKVIAGLPENSILRLTAVIFIGGMGSMLALGRFLDRWTTKPVLSAAAGCWVALLAGWAAVAGNVLPATAAVIGALMLGIGVGSTVVNQALTRLTMSLVPEQGRSHYFAVHSVIGSVVLGIAPVVWGIAIDSLAGLDTVWHGIHLNRYTLLFAALAIAFAAAAAFALRLVEPTETPEESLETLISSALARPHRRIWLRLWPRG